MCVYSMIVDHFKDKWTKPPYQQPITLPEPDLFPTVPEPIVPPIMIPTREEMEEFYRLLERAREYDKKHNQPDCELDEKKEALRKLAESMGITIKFD